MPGVVSRGSRTWLVNQIAIPTPPSAMTSPSQARNVCLSPCTWPTATSGPPLMSTAPTPPAAASIHFAAERMSSTESSGDGSEPSPTPSGS